MGGGAERSTGHRAGRSAAHGAERGAALLEAVLALAILATAGVAAAGMGAEAARAVERVREADREMRRAGALLEAVALWPREDLDRHLGDRRQGAWGLRVERPSSTLYVVVLSDSTGGRELLRTSLYRPAAEPGQSGGRGPREP